MYSTVINNHIIVVIMTWCRVHWLLCSDTFHNTWNQICVFAQIHAHICASGVFHTWKIVKPSVFPPSFKSLIPFEPSLKPPARDVHVCVCVCVRVKVWVMEELLMEECDDGWVWQADGFACRLFNHTDSAGREGSALSRHGNKQETNLPTILSRTLPRGWCFWLSVRKRAWVLSSKYVFKKAEMQKHQYPCEIWEQSVKTKHLWSFYITVSFNIIIFFLLVKMKRVELSLIFINSLQ